MSNINIYPQNHAYRLKAKWFDCSGLANLALSRSVFQFWEIHGQGKRVLRFRIGRYPLLDALKSGRIEAILDGSELIIPVDHPAIIELANERIELFHQFLDHMIPHDMRPTGVADVLDDLIRIQQKRYQGATK